MMWAQQARGIKLIVLYKFVKAALMLLLALWLMLAPDLAYRLATHGVQELAERGATGYRLAQWLNLHLTEGTAIGAAVLAWIDCGSSAVEGVLLLSARSWARWIVVIESAALLPIEVWSIWDRPGFGKLSILIANAHVAHRRDYLANPTMREMGNRSTSLWGLRRDGGEFRAEIRIGPIRTADGVAIAAAVRDATDNEKITTLLAQARDAADQANEIKSRFVAAASYVE